MCVCLYLLYACTCALRCEEWEAIISFHYLKSHTHIHPPTAYSNTKKSIEKQKRLVWCVSTTKPHYKAWANTSLLWKQHLTVKREPKQFWKKSSLAVWKNVVATKRLPDTVMGKTLFTASKTGWSGEGVPSDRGHGMFCHDEWPEGTPLINSPTPLFLSQ